MQPLVSVIIPVFNTQSFITECLNSIIGQSYKNLEIIIVDDASTDNTQSEFSKFHDVRIKVIRNKTNEGLAASVNKAITQANGEFIARMDGDDIAYSTRIEKQVEFLTKNKSISIVGSAMQSFGYYRYLHKFPTHHDGCKTQLLFNVCFGHPTVMFRSEVFRNPEHFYKSELKQYSEEYELWCRLVDKLKFANLPEPLLYYRTFDPNEKSDGEKKRRQNSKIIRKEFLEKQLGNISIADGEKHEHLSNLDKARDKDELNSWVQWLDKVEYLNTKLQSFDATTLSSELSNRRFEISYWNAHLGLSIWMDSFLTALSRKKGGYIKYIKFLIRCLVK